ncbi:hypothetical protein D1646_16375 [Pseudoflavonifractor sp. 60]|uniref:hypothetical protein n=1 Tax=Pseudoflavonifractor sp. 60 TaxID=2304576 RepID=UPI001371F1CD|nr:hypothetical protein [Pseudoflavonifractor sp. 60]NBI68344.1 hypothetical protein [Pseudoflavonifractor sp. 60]
MLLKLLKYDFRAMWKQFSLVWGAALVMSLVNRYTLDDRYAAKLVGETGSGLLFFVLVAVCTAMFIISILFVIQRFSRGLLGSEGYLMHTLPVRPWHLVISKLICALTACVGSTAVALISPLIMSRIRWSDLVQFPWWRLFWGLFKHLDALVLLGEFCLLLLSLITVNIAILYLSISLGHLFPRRRKLASAAAFIGLYVLLFNVYGRFFSLHIARQLMGMATENIYGSMLTASVIMLLPAGVCLAAVCWILEHKLNLE